MKKNYNLLYITTVLLCISFFSCNSEDTEEYIPVAPVNPVSPVVVDLTQVPYPKLSDYKFFEGELKDFKPAPGVLPFEPASSLFSDYAHKKRFIWMPAGVKATYNGDNKVLELPVGAAIVKSFYYDNVQNVTPVGATRIIETRIMIKRASGWLFANYVWNSDQTEAFYDMEGSTIEITWKDETNALKTAQYRIPTASQCLVCHKSSRLVDNAVQVTQIPIGIKPQNLNWNYNYGTETKNQLSKWIEQGYLENNFNLPQAANTTINYNDLSQPISLRARSYVDINCSHCHSDDRHCEYRPMRFAFSDTGNITNMGVCVETEDTQGFDEQLRIIVTPGQIDMSMLYYRINSTNPNIMMPLHGRSIIHTEGLKLMKDWINTLQECE